MSQLDSSYNASQVAQLRQRTPYMTSLDVIVLPRMRNENDIYSNVSKHLIEDWLDDVQKSTKECAQSGNNINLTSQYKAIQISAVDTTFKLADQLGVTSNIKYIALLLFDEFMYKYMEVFMDGVINNWEERLDAFSSKIKLYLLTCFQLASKMDLSYIRIEISEILEYLQIMDKETVYTRDMIVSSESEVFKMVGFKMPHDTPLSCVEVLLAATHRSEKDYEVAQLLLDVAFLQREELYTLFQRKTSGRVKFKKPVFLKSNMFFLSAAVVACTTLFHKKPESEFVVNILVEKSSSSKSDIMTMANILYDIATR
ncbi:PREDICTED: uncharacterized protein LOC106740596 [Dinoponera quadriceps]|uniref:Uncharacterized protein LOC106740596 n=1 Tax=Dinoponera quadriceps TaxID=609295 RepID=A0A6P3WMK1_DINQU|nr:PREDICTED: uncharacterized protein LOC106740596 [Dinoponera quadriceps]